MTTLEELRTLQSQYESGKDSIPDSEFDVKVQEYEMSSGKKFSDIGAPTRHNKIKLPYPMPSLDKIKGEKAEVSLLAWMKNHSSPYHISDKIDGMSALYHNGKLYSRGDGTIGSDISHVLETVKLLDKTVRGELILLKDDFLKLTGYKKARQTVVGAISKFEKLTIPIKFLAYNFYNEEPLSQLPILSKLGYDTPWYEEVSNLSISYLETTLRNRNPNYDIDGLVIRSKDGAEIAFKLDKSLRTTVTNIEWNISKDNKWKPVVIYEEIYFEATHTRASGKNAKFIMDNNIGIGSEIEISKAGDVIPDITNIYSSGTLVYPPSAYEWNDTKVDFISTEDSRELKIANILHFMKSLSIKEMGEGRITTLVDANFNLKDILTMKPSDIISLDRIGEKLANKMVDSIQNGIKNVELSDVMVASNFFTGLGKKRLASIVANIPDILDRDVTFEEVKTEGCNTLSEVVIRNLPKFRSWLRELPIKLSSVSTTVSPINTSDPKMNILIKKEVIVFSGFRDKKLQDKIISKGNIVEEQVTKRTTLLIVSDTTSTSAKTKKALEYNIPVIHKDNYL